MKNIIFEPVRFVNSLKYMGIGNLGRCADPEEVKGQRGRLSRKIGTTQNKK